MRSTPTGEENIIAGYILSGITMARNYRYPCLGMWYIICKKIIMRWTSTPTTIPNFMVLPVLGSEEPN